MNLSTFLRLATLLPVCILCSCQRLIPPPITSTKISANTWSLSAKASIITPEDSVSGNLTWQQQPNHFVLIFSHPLASQDWVLSGSKQEVTLRYGQKVYSARTPEELLMTHLHWSLPVSSLPHWVRGQPSSASPVEKVQFDSQQRYHTFRQQGFLIEYLEYNNALPSLLRISSAQLTLKIKIHRWQPS